MHVNIVTDTSSLLKSAEQIFDIVKKESLKLIIPKEVINELDNIKDKPKHKENCNAHKVIGSINNLNIDICDKNFNGANNDDKIVECARFFSNNGETYIVSEDKTFKAKFKNTLTFNEFLERFETCYENKPDDKTRIFFDYLANKQIELSLQYLKQNELKINAYNEEGFTALILAIKLKDMGLIETILQYKGVDVHKCDCAHLRMTPLAYAVQDDRLEIVKLLLQYNTKPYIANKGKNKCNTPFLMACWDNRKNAIPIMEVLYKYGISINQVDGNGFSGLIKASIKGHENIAKWLLEKGADIKIRDFHNRSALDYAREKKHKKLIELLRSYNA